MHKSIQQKRYFYAASPQSIQKQACYDFKSKVYRPPYQKIIFFVKPIKPKPKSENPKPAFILSNIWISVYFRLRYQYKAIKHHPKRHLLREGHLLQDPNLTTNKNIGSRWNFCRGNPLGKPDVSSASSIEQGDT